MSEKGHLTLHEMARMEAIRLTATLRQMKQPDPLLFNGQKYVVQIAPEIKPDNTLVNRIAAEMPYPTAHAGKLADRQGVFVMVDRREKEKFDRYPLPHMEKRFRDEYGQLTMRSDALLKKTAEEASRYYIAGKLYLIEGQLFKYNPFVEKGVTYGKMTSPSGKQMYLPPVSDLGTHLPDVSSRGAEIIALDDRRYIRAEMAQKIKTDAKREQRQQNPKPAKKQDIER